MLQESFKRIKENKAPMNVTSDWLILHIHGGGFISQTSESHQLYLKDWSRWTDDSPILSVDYSLAPEAPHPRALEEVLYAYVWALNNFDRLGTTGKRIVLAGLYWPCINCILYTCCSWDCTLKFFRIVQPGCKAHLKTSFVLTSRYFVFFFR